MDRPYSGAQPRPADALRRRRHALLRQLPSLKEILRGSLIERYIRCGKPGCKCADGPGYGPKYYLSMSHPGLRPQMDYVPQESHAQIAEFLANYHRGPQDLRSDLRDQPRTAAPPGGALNGHHERSSVRPPCVNRCWIGWRAPRQYGRSLARWQPGWCDKRGGSQ